MGGTSRMTGDGHVRICERPRVKFPRPTRLFWLMIPYSRAIDTLVLHIRSRTTYLGHALHAVCGRCGDFVEWVKV